MTLFRFTLHKFLVFTSWYCRPNPDDRKSKKPFWCVNHNILGTLFSYLVFCVNHNILGTLFSYLVFYLFSPLVFCVNHNILGTLSSYLVFYLFSPLVLNFRSYDFYLFGYLVSVLCTRLVFYTEVQGRYSPSHTSLLVGL